MSGHAHEGIALNDHVVGVGLAVSGGQVEGAKLGCVLSAGLDVLKSPVAQCGDRGFFGGEESCHLILAQSQGILA